MQVTWSDRARSDLQSIRDHLTGYSSDVAQRVATALWRAGESLELFPHRGWPGVDGTRELVVRRFPYIIVYDVVDEAVNIIRTWRMAQDRLST